MAAESNVPQPRELPLRDVRDLALAVVEGAVAAESLAKELRRTPDRSKHFQEIAERLRMVVGRPSIRSALADDGTEHVAVSRASTGARNSVQLAVPPQLRSSGSGEHAIPELVGGSPQLDRIETMVQRIPGQRAFDALEARLARIEQLAGRSLDGERQIVRTPEEALALASRLIERLRRENSVAVRIEP